MPSAAWSAAARTPSSVAGCAGQRLLDAAGPQRRGAHVGEPDPGLADRAAVGLDGRGDRDDRPLVGHPDELLVVGAPAGVLGDPDLGEDLVLADRGLEEVDEEVVGRDRAGAARRRRSRTRAPSASAGGPEVTGRVGVRQRAAERAAVPDLGVGDLARPPW